VYDDKLTEPMARVLKKLGTKSAFVVHGEGPLDEVSIAGRTRVSELKGGRVKSYYVTPGTFGVKKASLRSIKGGTAKDNARIIRSVLSGEKGPKRDIVLVNSSVALVAAGKVKNFKEGVRVAARAIDSGEALEKLKQLIKITNKGAR
jgi:anthranilate phosphoribosyltransferase